MVYFYSGTGGSGKSLHMAINIHDDLVYGRNVIAVFPIATEKIKKMKGKFEYISIYDISPKYLYDYAREHHKYTGNPRKDEGQTAVYIDEAHRIFNPRDYTMYNRRAWLEFFAEHRHLGYDVILASPMEKMIDRQIRGCFEYEVKHRKASNFGPIGSFLKILHVELFFCIKYWYGVRQVCGRVVIRPKRKYTQLYNTMLDFNKKDEGGAPAVDGGAESCVGGPAAADGAPISN